MFQELAAAGDLYSYLHANGGVLGDLDSRVIVRQITLAVLYLHSNGVVHRDIKLENILVTHKDIGHRIVLTDFGCSADIRGSTKRMVSLVGTKDYAAPSVQISHQKTSIY